MHLEALALEDKAQDVRDLVVVFRNEGGGGTRHRRQVYSIEFARMERRTDDVIAIYEQSLARRGFVSDS